MSTAIEIRGVSKRFRLYQEQFTSVKERILHGGKVPFDDFWALKDIRFEVEEGSTFGLLGHNGSGKSTLLKCIAGIIKPTSGDIVTRGRVAALLELGAGFQPELSGRENVYLNAALLGMSKSFVDARFDEIVEFAELAPFIDNQVKYYSSGMYVRLGFAVAVNMDPDILIVDEVLAVGDEMFQRKCLDRVKAFQEEGRTIVVVTHSPDLVRQVCTDAAVLDSGLLIAVGDPNSAVRDYREHLLARRRLGEAHEMEALLRSAEAPQEPQASEDPGEAGDAAAEPAPAPAPLPSDDLEMVYARINGTEGSEVPQLKDDEDLVLVLGYRARRTVTDVVGVAAVYATNGIMIFAARTDWSGQDMGVIEGTGELTFRFPSPPLLDGTYAISYGLHNTSGTVVYGWSEQERAFSVINDVRAAGLVRVPVDVACGPSTPPPAAPDAPASAVPSLPVPAGAAVSDD